MQMRRIKALFTAQLKELRRDFGALFLSFVFPLFFVVILISSNLVNSAITVEFALVQAVGKG